MTELYRNESICREWYSMNEQKTDSVTPWRKGGYHHRGMWTPELVIREVVASSSGSSLRSRRLDIVSCSTSSPVQGGGCSEGPSELSSVSRITAAETTTDCNSQTLSTPPSLFRDLSKGNRTPAFAVTTTRSGNGAITAPRVTPTHGDGAAPAAKKAVAVRRDSDTAAVSLLAEMNNVLSSPGSSKGGEPVIAQLRKQLSSAQSRNCVLATELSAAKEMLTDTSFNVEIREQECVELNALVDCLQRENVALTSELRSVEADLRRAHQEIKELRSCVSGGGNNTAALSSVTDARSVLDRQNTSQIASLTAQVAEYQAVLDRLGLSPPFDDAMIGTAKRRAAALKKL